MEEIKKVKKIAVGTMKKRIKRIGLLVFFLLLGFAVAVCLIMFKMNVSASDLVGNEKTSTPIVTEQNLTVDKPTVIEALRSNEEIVGMDGTFQKVYPYEDNVKIFGMDWQMMHRKFDMILTGTYKYGIDLNEINPDNVTVFGNVIQIELPKIKLISFDAPYDQIQITKELNLREDFTEEERQSFYKDAREKAINDITSSPDVQEQAKKDTEDAIKKILMIVPNVKDVQFKDSSESKQEVSQSKQ